MAKRFLTPVAFPILDRDPDNIEGSVYFNRVIGALKVFDGSVWQILATTGQIPVVGIDGGYAPTALFDNLIDGGLANTTIFESMLDAGAAVIA